jgi:diguanylate cyclase
MDSFAYIAPWVLASVCIGIVVGYYMSRSRGKCHELELAERERHATLKVLVELLSAVEQMNGDVECHNTEIQQTAHDVGNLRVSGEMESVKQALLGRMVSLLTSNKRLQNDLLCTQYRMEEQAQEIDHARREARIDALTSVANRKAFEEKFHLLLSAWSRQQQPFVLMMVDLDHLKRINDAHGHQAGDLVLEKMGRWLKQWVRERDFVARYGGDEFVLLLPRTELAAGVEIAQSICFRAADQASRVTFRGEQVSVSLSIGVTVSGEDDTADAMLRRADRALYRSKQMGRNQVQFETPSPADVLAPFAAAADSALGTFPSLQKG